MKKRIYLISLISIIVVIVLLISRNQSPNLQFEARQYPAGFRNLLLDSRSSKGTNNNSLLVGIEDNISKQERGSINNMCGALFCDPADPTIGPSNAAVTIVEFFDYQCPYCRIVSEFIIDLQENDPRVRIVFKEWPILGEYSEVAASAALAANLQGQYLEFRNALMSYRSIKNVGLIRHLANEVIKNPNQLIKEMKLEEIRSVIHRNKQIAKQLKFIGTPSFVVGRTVVEGKISRSELEGLVDLEAKNPMSAIC